MSSYIKRIKGLLNESNVKFTEPQENFLRVKTTNPKMLIGMLGMYIGGWGIAHSGLEYKVKHIPETEVLIYKWDFVIQKKWQNIWRHKNV